MVDRMASNNPFHYVGLINRSGHGISPRMIPDVGAIPSQDPVLLPNGAFEIPIIQPRGEERHAILGIFLDEWSKLEMQVARLLALSLGSDPMEMPVLMNGLGSRGQRDALTSLLLPRLKDGAASKLQKIMEKIKAHTTRRNHIIHGYWYLEVVITDRNGVPWPNYRQYRRYDPSDIAARRQLDSGNETQARKNYMFSLSRIQALSAEMQGLWHEFSSITERDTKPAPQRSVRKITAVGG